MERLIIWNSWQSNSLIFVSFWHILFKGRVKVFFFFFFGANCDQSWSDHNFFLSGVNFFLSISDCYEVVIFLFSGGWSSQWSPNIRGLFCIIFLYYPLTPKSDQEVVSPYDISSISRRQVMRIKKIIKKEISYDSTPNSQHLNRKEMYARQKGELVLRSWELKGPSL